MSEKLEIQYVVSRKYAIRGIVLQKPIYVFDSRKDARAYAVRRNKSTNPKGLYIVQSVKRGPRG